MARSPEVEMQEGDGVQTIIVTFEHSSQTHRAFYRRKKGYDTWFTFFGKGQNVDNTSMQDADFDETRTKADKILRKEGYPIKPADDNTSDSGELNIMFDCNSHSYAFITNPNTFYVYDSNTTKKKSKLEEDEIEITILSGSENENVVEVEYTDGGADVPDYAVEEAALCRYRITSGDKDLPSVDIL